MDPPIEPETPQPELIDSSVNTQPESIDLINSKRESERDVDIEKEIEVNNDVVVGDEDVSNSNSDGNK
nr:11092_t:CDS:2 [Entrophospora candida]CAG8499879.1 1659_t:CDS:2 [Entrophospora candida]